jgi:hypothetical protein
MYLFSVWHDQVCLDYVFDVGWTQGVSAALAACPSGCWVSWADCQQGAGAQRVVLGGRGWSTSGCNWRA